MRRGPTAHAKGIYWNARPSDVSIGGMTTSELVDDGHVHSDAERAALSLGASNSAIYAMVQRTLRARKVLGGTLVDVGCGGGGFYPWIAGDVSKYLGCDLVEYQDFTARVGTTAGFVSANLNSPPYPLEEASADVVVAIETIEHLENPRAFMRELVRIARPGGTVAVTTPNQLSFLSKFTLTIKNQFNAFQDVCYPAHITALLPVDLQRIALECRLRDIEITYSNVGRMPLTAKHWPRPLRGRAFSDNVLIVGTVSS